MSSKNMFSEKRNFRFGDHCVKSVFIWSFSGRYFPAFSLNAGKYRPEKLRIRTLFMQCIFKRLTDESSALNLHLIGTTSSRFGIIFL